MGLSNDEGDAFLGALGVDRMEEAPVVEMDCQELGLVAIMFFFELLFSYVSSSISFYVPLTNLFSIIHSPYLLITRDTQDEGEARFRFY